MRFARDFSCSLLQRRSQLFLWSRVRSGGKCGGAYKFPMIINMQWNVRFVSNRNWVFLSAGSFQRIRK